MGKHFLLVRFSSIGDIVLCSPVVRCIRNAFPDARITFVTKKKFAYLPEALPAVDEVLCLDSDLNTLRKQLKERSFDYLVDLHKNLRTKLLLWDIPGNYRAFNKLNIEKWLLVALKINRLPKVHIVQRYLDTVSDLGVEYDGGGLDFPIPNTTRLPGALPKGPFLSMAIGGQVATKRLPLHKLTELVEKINLPLVILGGNEDRETGERLKAHFPNKELVNCAGQLSIFESAAVCRESIGLITHDTGMMHIATALDKPVISIWGNTVPILGMFPFFKENSNAEKQSSLFEVPDLKCRPCSKIGYNTCPKGHFNCMEKQDTTAIASAITRLSPSEK